MRILFQVPHLSTIYAGLSIYHGYKNAFEDMGHDFKFLTADDIQKKVYEEFGPHVLFTSLNPYFLKFLDLRIVAEQKKKGLRVFVNIPFWRSPMSKLRANEAPSLSDRKDYLTLIRSGDYGDVYFNSCRGDDERMEGFEKGTGYKHFTVPLAADKTLNAPKYSERYKADISFIGTNLPDRRRAFEERVFPLKRKYDLKLYGQDWTVLDRFLGIVQKVGQYFNVQKLKSFQKRQISLEEVSCVYTSSLISINIHEDYQVRYGGECNSRTFEIPLSGGFEIVDDVSCIRDYFKVGDEIIIAKDTEDWFDKIDYFIRNSEKREPIIEAGRKRVLSDHTYHNRVQEFLEIYSKF